ncbi:MAG: hypothetical protein NC305_19120, partial [Lachnospiraceae bacterium]|nr:hypothetical protein [Lachnospiraceae bacterium]
ILWFVFTVAAGFVLWFIAAPLPRYGSVYVAMMPLLAIGKLLSRESVRKRISGGKTALMVTAVVSYCIHPILYYAVDGDWKHLRRSANYAEYDCVEYELDGEIIYVPEKGDQAGYFAFPSTPYAARLDLIELRGEDISGGFRMKEEYKNAFVTSSGELDETDMFSGH